MSYILNFDGAVNTCKRTSTPWLISKELWKRENNSGVLLLCEENMGKLDKSARHKPFVKVFTAPIYVLLFPINRFQSLEFALLVVNRCKLELYGTLMMPFPFSSEKCFANSRNKYQKLSWSTINILSSVLSGLSEGDSISSNYLE